MVYNSYNMGCSVESSSAEKETKELIMDINVFWY